MILVIDNYDSFTYNLVQFLGEMGADLQRRPQRSDDADEIQAMQPTHIVISPGPGDPDDGGVSLDVIRHDGRDHADPGRLPGASVHRAGVWRRRASRRAADARQDQPDLPQGRCACSTGCPVRSRRRAITA